MKLSKPTQATQNQPRSHTQTDSDFRRNKKPSTPPKHTPSISKHTDSLKTLSKQTQFNPSNTGVYPIRTHGFGVYHGPREVWSVRVDKKLVEQAKPLLVTKYGSICRGIEAWLAGLVAVAKGEQLSGVYPRNTVDIGKLVIERNMRSRRKLVIEEEVEVSSVCGHVDCDADAVGSAVWRGQKLFSLCQEHFAEAKLDPKNWRSLEKRVT